MNYYNCAVLIVALVLVSPSYCSSDSFNELSSTSTSESCPAGEYNPGPDCGLEPTCAPRSSHFIPKHTCDCWCLPGTYRDLDTNQCTHC